MGKTNKATPSRTRNVWAANLVEIDPCHWPSGVSNWWGESNVFLSSGFGVNIKVRPSDVVYFDAVEVWRAR